MSEPTPEADSTRGEKKKNGLEIVPNDLNW
jgi:hypothetical protein